MTVFPNPSIRVKVDPTNPGQFFACCGLLELADRLFEDGAEGWFAEGGREFRIECEGTLRELLTAAKSTTIAGMDGVAELEGNNEADDNEDDDDFKPVELLSPVSLRLDWWKDKSIKTWAGSMDVHSIASAMAYAIDPHNPDPFNQCQVVYDPPKVVMRKGKRVAVKSKKREPFYFDSRRGSSAHARDIGFSPNELSMISEAAPAVEFFCLLGLQRSRPKQAGRPRVFHYFTWTSPLKVELLPAALCGFLPCIAGVRYQFENAFRTGDRKLKAYAPAIPLPLEGD